MMIPVRTRFADLDDAAATSARLVPAGGTSGQVLAKASGTDYATHWVDAATGGGGGTPGGSSGQLQYNNAGAFAGDSSLTYDVTTHTLTLAGTLVTASASTYQAKFGSTLPFYVMANNPTLGFNAYYSGGWLYGTTGYGGIVDFGAGGDGSYTLYTTAASGTGGAALTLVSRFKVYPTGSVFFGSNPSDLGSAVAIQPSSSSAVGAIVRGAASQSANLQEWQDSTGTVVAAITPAGVFSGTVGQAQVTGLTSALAAKAPLASPALTGTPTAPTATVGTNTTQIATTAFVLANAGGGSIASTSSVLKGNGAGGAVAAVAATDYPGLATANTFTDSQTVKSSSSSTGALQAHGSGSGDQTFLSCFRGSDGYNFINLKSRFSTGVMLLEVNSAGLVVEATNFQFQTSGTTLFQATGLYGWVDSSTATLFQVGGPGYSAIYAGSAGGAVNRAAFIGSAFQFGPTAYGSIPVPDALFDVTSTSTTLPTFSLTAATSQTAPLARLRRPSSTSTARNAGYIDATLATATDASWKGRVTVSAGDFSSSHAGMREGVRVESDGTQPLLSFYGKTPAVAKAAAPTTLADVIALLQALGLCS